MILGWGRKRRLDALGLFAYEESKVSIKYIDRGSKIWERDFAIITEWVNLYPLIFVLERSQTITAQKGVT